MLSESSDSSPIHLGWKIAWLSSFCPPGGRKLTPTCTNCYFLHDSICDAHFITAAGRRQRNMTNYNIGTHHTVNSSVNQSLLLTVYHCLVHLTLIFESEQAANAVTLRLLPITGIAKKHGVCRLKLIVRPAALQRGYKSNNSFYTVARIWCQGARPGVRPEYHVWGGT